MSARTPQLRPNSSTQRNRRKQLWDRLTITLALAVVLLGLAIFLAPKVESHSNSQPSKRLPASMASLAPAQGLSAERS